MAGNFSPPAEAAPRIRPRENFDSYDGRFENSAVQSSVREEMAGANVLVAASAEHESHVVYFLQEQRMMLFDAINTISGGEKGGGDTAA
jgi:hypothetical protein